MPGFEVGGHVVTVGPGGAESLIGRWVVATTVGMTGGYAELARAEPANLFEVPAGLPLEQAIAAFQAGALAIGLLSAIRLRAAETVLVTAAAGRIGSLLVQHAKTLGGRVIGAVGDAKKAATVTELGADHVVDYSDPEWAAAVRGLTGGRGADVALDAIGGNIGGQALIATAAGSGRFVPYGFASGAWVELDARQIARRGLSVVGGLGTTFAKPLSEQPGDAEQALQAALAGLETRQNIGASLLHT